METQGEYPEVPPNLDLHNPRHEMMAASLAGGSGTAPGGSAQQTQHATTANEDMNSLNRIAVAGLGMRKHTDDGNFIGNNFQPQQNKRGRADENQGDGSDVVAKQEGHLPMA